MSSSIEKIVAKMKQSNKGHRFEDCEKVLKAKGYEMKAGKGDHFKFFKTDEAMIVIARHRPVSPNAVNDVIKAWDS